MHCVPYPSRSTHACTPFARIQANARVAANLVKIFADSAIMANKSGKVQDGYSMRCTPQILGPSLEILEYAAT